MKSLSEIHDLLKQFEKRFGYAVDGCEQGSEAWFKMKIGVLSSSNAHKIVAKRDSETRKTYMCSLIGQICTLQVEEINARAMDWGKINEAASRSYYEFATGLKITELPFVFKDNTFRVGCSPDGIVNDKKGMEIKCPFDSANYIKFLVDESRKSEWEWQENFTMWVMEADQWDFSQYDPRMKIKPMKTITSDRDEKKIKTIEDAVPQFIHDMDVMLKQIGIEFGNHWHMIAEDANGGPGPHPKSPAMKSE